MGEDKTQTSLITTGSGIVERQKGYWVSVKKHGMIKYNYYKMFGNKMVFEIIKGLQKNGS